MAASVLVMNHNLSLGDYLQIKSKRLQGCSREYRGFVFGKKSILVGYVPGFTSEGGEFELSYMCVGELWGHRACYVVCTADTLSCIQEYKTAFLILWVVHEPFPPI